ncbi:5'-nucleotidase C-terminal domain-containing protein [Pontibacillus sp. HMF3514]|uniref:5'-nucleotidase C-terminal domain-containing protein n=1 Tax=Pontibacillus sp. HMF3514 TaxID=2692425 RepID=UPI00131F793F|nr:5'-nucleotidase C-terminal domain-containing protein [Pontibacillus sp. HMF3514]QHE51503.1 LysM peptidoglycan-binding domain-containing protein [Pontibacillus sp. HMF3514]
MGKVYTKLLAGAMTAVMGLAPFTAQAADEGNVEVQLLFMNDLHGKIDYESSEKDVNGDGVEDSVGGMPYLATYLEQREAENENTLLLHSGDMIGGSPLVSAYFQDEPTIEIMEAMGFDVGTLGNHEFDEGVEEMLRMINGGEHPDGTEGYDGMNFPVVAANVQYKDTKDLVIDPYTIEEIGGQKIGFIGVVTTETPEMIIKTGNENVEFTDEAEAINKYVPELQAQGVEAIVVLAHNPAFQEGETITGDAAEIAKNTDDAVDVIFAGHNHVYNNGLVDNKLIVQALDYSRAFADVDLEIDPETGDIVKKSAEIVNNIRGDVEPDQEVSEILNKYQEKVKEAKEEVVGNAAVKLDGGYAARGEVGDNALGNLIADGMVEAMDADFALMNGGGIRDVIDQGEITFGEVFAVQPFGNTLNKVELTGKDLRKVLNAQISEKYGPDVSVSGFSYTWNGKTNEVVSMKLPDGSAVKPNETYTVVVNNYMYGAEDYRLAELGENMVVGPNDLDATIEYIQSFDEPIIYEAEGRISEVTAKADENNGKDQSDKSDETTSDETTDSKANDHKYTVKSGDTLGKIGAKFGVSWKKLAEYNNIEDVRKLMSGQTLSIPVPDGNAGYEVYLVKQGDTIGKIAAKYDVNWKDLANYNKLANPHFISIGQEIKIPKN